MSCTSCSSKINNSKNDNSSKHGCSNYETCSSSSGKLTVYDWLSNMTLPGHQNEFDHFEVRFKNGRKAFFKNTNNLSISIGATVTVEDTSGHDVGIVTLKGELVKVQMNKKKVKIDSEAVLQIYRIATQKDIDIWQEARSKEGEIQRKTRLIIDRLGLKMKLSDVEFQGNGKKATFYYTANERVDFRMLIREMASTFNIRIEMKQVGSRQEAARLGGIGSCGRELCCSTWLTDFRSVNTSAARYQQLSLNPQKLSGQCGKLKCCLNFELDSYIDALKAFPNTDTWLQTKQGTAVYQKMDIFNGWVWYAYKDNPVKWHKLTTEQANEIIALNKEKKKPQSLEEYSDELIIEIKKEVFTNVVGQDSLTRFDKPKNKKRRNKRRNNNSKATNNNQNNANQNRRKNTNKNKQNPNQSKKQGSNQKKTNQNKKQNPNQNNTQQKKKNPNQQNKKTNQNKQQKPNNE